MRRESAVSEIIGAILLIGILVGAFGIFAAIYIPTLVPQTVPQLKISMACNKSGGPADIEYPCTQGSFNCHPYPFDNKTCEEDCKWRDYSLNPDISSEEISKKTSQCLENCLNPICSDLEDCEVIYICHNGGDSLEISEMNVLVNGQTTPKENWAIKHTISGDDFSSPIPEGSGFINGDSIRITSSWSLPVDTIMITYSLPSGSEVMLTMNQFGTDIQ